MMDLTDFSNKDKGIISRNPGATPYELYTVHGISQKGYERLIANREGKILGVATEQAEAPQPKKPAASRRIETNAVIVENVKTGKRIRMSAYNAKFLNKNQFKIVG